MKLPILYEPETKEYYLIELQGTVEFLDPNCKELGELEWNQGKSKPILTIGHHKLKGELEELKKPFGVLLKNKESNSFTLSTVIYKKCIFKSRPEHQLSDKFTGLHQFMKKR